MVVSQKKKNSKRKLKKFKNYRKTKLKFQKGGKYELELERITTNDASLKQLDFSNDKEITVDDITLITNALKHNTNVEDLNFSHCNLTDDSATLIAKLLNSNNTIKKLNLSYNRINDDGGINIAFALEKNKGLEDLDISYNSINYIDYINNINNTPSEPGMPVMNGIPICKGITDITGKQLEISLIRNKTLKTINTDNTCITYRYNNFINFPILNEDEIKLLNEKLLDINKKLNDKCKHLYIVINFAYEFKNITAKQFLQTNKELLLCLNYKNICISSLKLDIKDDTISLSSSTEKNFEGYKFNKLLSAILILIAKYINPNIKTIEAYAVNPISAYLQLKVFKATTNDDRLTSEIINGDLQIFKKIINDIISIENEAIITICELNEENIQNAKHILDLLLQKKQDKYYNISNITEEKTFFKVFNKNTRNNKNNKSLKCIDL